MKPTRDPGRERVRKWAWPGWRLANHRDLSNHRRPLLPLRLPLSLRVGRAPAISVTVQPKPAASHRPLKPVVMRNHRTGDTQDLGDGGHIMQPCL